MLAKTISTKRKLIVSSIAIVCSAIFAILVHAALPSSIDVNQFDSGLVKLFGFPIVATVYFLLLYTHCALVVHYLGSRSGLPNFQMGARFGLAFALIYVMGMQEVAVEASPFTSWGLDFVKYEFIMGIGDAIPVLLLCIILACFSIDKEASSVSATNLKRDEGIRVIGVITVAFFIERVVGYGTGLIGSEVNTYPVQTYVWTMLFGIVLGLAYVLLYPIFSQSRSRIGLNFKLVVLTIGVNWILFNSFIGLIFKGAISQTLLRSSIDVIVIFVVILFVNLSRNQSSNDSSNQSSKHSKW